MSDTPSIENPGGIELDDGNVYRACYTGTHGDYNQYELYKSVGDHFEYAGRFLSRTGSDEENLLRARLMLDMTDYFCCAEDLATFDPD